MKRRDLFKLAMFAPLVPKMDLLPAAAPVKVATNFASLSAAQRAVWSRDLWEHARKGGFFDKFQGTEVLGEIAQSGSARGS